MKILDNLKNISTIRYFSNVNKGVRPFLLNEIKNIYSKKNVLVVLDNNNEINHYYYLFKNFFNLNNILKFPSWDSIPYEEVSPSQNILNDRFQSFNKFQNKNSIEDSFLLLTNLDAFIQLIPNKSYLINNYFSIKLNENLSLEELNSKLYNEGYERVSVVLEPLEYAVRGGIIDVWPVGDAYPVRIDFYGNNIENIKAFNPISQITIKELEGAIISGSIESPKSKTLNKIFIENYRNLFGPSVNKNLFVHKLKNNIKADGIENWLPLFYPGNLCSITKFFNIEVVIADNNFLEKSQDKLNNIFNLYEEKKKLIEKESEVVNSPLHPNTFYLSSQNLEDIYKNSFFKELGYLYVDSKKPVYEINCKENLEFHNLNLTNEVIIQKLKEIINDLHQQKKIIITYSHKDEKDKALNLLHNLDITNYRDNKKNINECLDNFEIIDLILFPLLEGFELSLLKIITLSEIFKTKSHLKPKKIRNNLIDIAQLHFNDLVVHFLHGVGRYLGLKTIKINNSPHDCLIIEYLEKSKLYVPVEDIRLISKFGDSRENIILDRLGASSWLKRKSNVKEKIRDLANTLITVAAKRASLKGIKFEIDYNKLATFSKSFIFNETDDQLATLDEVYRDLGSGKLMDRLVCGDVGFGKTEIALRASFIVTDNNFSVLLVAPTTLLARQHFITFKKRFKEYARVDLLDRNINSSRKKDIIKEFTNKDIKILVTTHAIFSINLNKVDIGLVIIDEEQRFGVSHKEKIKKIKSNVHLLTLTATPIPRTLHMSLLGIKDLSLIKTPPVDRKSINTKVIKFESTIIKHAIFNEKKRSGQIYLIVPKVKYIPEIRKKIISIYPNLRLGIAHGKLSSKELELAMNNFYNYKIDLLIATTIVEAGLDIPRANTLIVYKSDYFGLAQLHQLRGRIGRGAKKAYAYFTLENNNISSNAMRRLKALQTMDALGAGMQLANYDLDIRGAGNLLGEEQSGQIIQVGIEMYQRLLKECINDLKGIESLSNAEEIEVSIKLPILIPEKYIPDLSLRLSLYRRVGEFQDLEELNMFREEMINRFGIIPEEFCNYLDVMSLKLLAGKCSISKIYVLSKYFQITFDKKRRNYSETFINWITENKNRILLKDSHVIKINHNLEDPKKQLVNIIDLVKTMVVLLKK
ncbi:MAG: Transcription-repair-coupling factor [Alphaproteobacteria bacterium MarineAlpha9_Bin4]|nr:transcription-repair coupling factor [Pelagibacterales bacterium]PPR25923.1 MAG: Transcription-repair-coupling factor [Alphaproteobacteria bacterium MarineAlpha9_Bin4]